MKRINNNTLVILGIIAIGLIDPEMYGAIVLAGLLSIMGVER